MYRLYTYNFLHCRACLKNPIMLVSSTGTDEIFALHTPSSQNQSYLHNPADKQKVTHCRSLAYILDKLVKQDVDMLTEIIPHKPQKRWFAREYFSTSWTSCSTSVSLGRLPVHNGRHVFKYMKMTIIHNFQRTFYLGSSCCITYQNLGERFQLIFSVYKVCIYSYSF